MKKVYLDYAATTPVDEEVLQTMLPYFSNKFGNPSSIHTFGQETRSAVEISRETIAKILKVKQSEIYFTSGGTEAINFAVVGAAEAIKNETGKNHIITSKAEHHATLETCEYLSKRGFGVTFLSPTNNGNINPTNIFNSVRKETALISLMHVNNEVGAINDIKSISDFTQNQNIVFHTDAVQSFAKFDLDLSEIKVDLLSASSHKIYGPKGAGFLFIRTGTPISPILHGGSQERNRRGGTENTPAIIGFAKAAELYYSNRQDYFNHAEKLRNYFKEKLLIFPQEEVTINFSEQISSPYIFNISVSAEKFRISGDTLIMNLDINGVAVSSGSACTSGVVEPSYVLLAMGFDENRASNAIRFSFGKSTTFEELDYAVDILKDILNRLRR